MMARRTRFIVPLLVILIAAGCQGAAQQVEEATPTPLPTPIVPTRPIYTVQRGEVVKILEFNGRIAPVTEQELFFRTAGYVAKVYVKKDVDVKAGDLLAELEVTDLKNQLAQAEADLEAIRFSTERQVAEAEAALYTAELRLAQARINDPGPQVVIAEVELERAQLGLKDAQKEYQDVLDQPWLPDPVKAKESALRGVHEAELSLKVAQAQYDQAVQTRKSHYYDVQLLEQDVELARKRVAELQVGAELQKAELAVKRLQDLIADAQIVAPFDGRILSLTIADGRQAEAYKVVIVLGNMSALEVSAELDAKQMEQLAEGMEATAVVSSRPGEEFHGAIRSMPYPYGGGGLSTSVEDVDKSTRVTLNVDPAEAGLKIGDSIRVIVTLERKADVLWLPPQAIRTFEGRKFIVVQTGEGQQRVDVKVGIEGVDRVEIKEGVTEGQVIVGQ